MDFKRIEWIFLVAFIAIDVFLFVSFTTNNQFTTTTSTGSSRESTILKEMKDDSITVNTLSAKRSSGYYISSDGGDILTTQSEQLTNQSIRFNDDELIGTFTRPITIDENDPSKVLNRIVANKNRISFGSHYVYDAQLTASASDTIVYVQKGPGKNVFSSDGVIRFKQNSKNQITGYTQTYMHAIKTLREKEATISQKKAVIWLYQHNEIPNNSKIRWAKLGYTKLLSLKGNTVYIPTWVINIQTKNTAGSQTKRINAFTGTLIKADTSLTDESAGQ